MRYRVLSDLEHLISRTCCDTCRNSIECYQRKADDIDIFISLGPAILSVVLSVPGTSNFNTF